MKTRFGFLPALRTRRAPFLALWACLAGLAALLPPLAAAAGNTTAVYRCGPDGREFSQSPCKDGRAIEVPRDERSAEQRAQAQAAARAEAGQAEQLRQERLAREAAAARPLLPAQLGPIDRAVKAKDLQRAEKKKNEKNKKLNDRKRGADKQKPRRDKAPAPAAG